MNISQEKTGDLTAIVKIEVLEQDYKELREYFGLCKEEDRLV